MTEKNWTEILKKGSTMYHQMQSPLRLHLLALFSKESSRVFNASNLSKLTGILIKDVIACLRPMIEQEVVEELVIPGGNGYRLVDGGRGGLLEAIQGLLSENSPMVESLHAVREKFFGGMIGVDEKMKIVFELIRTVSRYDSTVLIIGEAGTGKEQVAQAIHELSSRATQPFVSVNCRLMPQDQFHHEMFGADDRDNEALSAPGFLEQAANGSLFLDEVNHLVPANQLKMLRLLTERSYIRAGGLRSQKANVRLIAASSQSLENLVHTGEFREDFFYRLNVFSINLPSLRERPEDIPVLAVDYLRKYCVDEFGDPSAKAFSEESLSLLKSYDWPGNLVELGSVVSRVAVTSRDELISTKDLEAYLPIDPVTKKINRVEVKPMTLQQVEEQHIRRMLRLTNWNIKRASEILGISRVTLYKKIKEYQINRPAA